MFLLMQFTLKRSSEINTKQKRYPHKWNRPKREQSYFLKKTKTKLFQ